MAAHLRVQHCPKTARLCAPVGGADAMGGSDPLAYYKPSVPDRPRPPERQALEEDPGRPAKSKTPTSRVPPPHPMGCPGMRSHVRTGPASTWQWRRTVKDRPKLEAGSCPSTLTTMWKLFDITAALRPGAAGSMHSNEVAHRTANAGDGLRWVRRLCLYMNMCLLVDVS